jgi:hypothetical protein
LALCRSIFVVIVVVELQARIKDTASGKVMMQASKSREWTVSKTKN